jgi:uncharacterized protein
MSRPRKERKIFFSPNVVYFKPRAVPLSALKEMNLDLDEIEALRLCDLEGRKQKEASQKMRISQSTFSRILVRARKKTAQALVKGEAISIQKK